jgi:hypothetical protein
VLEYLGRYVHRIAIANSRLESFDGERVVFRYRDNRSGEIRRCQLEAQDFLGRFLQHVLPRSFVKIRSYGLYSSGCRPALELARQAIPRFTRDANSDTASGAAVDGSSDEPDSVALRTCPRCRLGRLHVVADLLPTRTRAPPCIRAPP